MWCRTQHNCLKQGCYSHAEDPPSKPVFQNSAVAYNASVFIISVTHSRHSLELPKSCTLFKNYRLLLLIFQPRQPDFSQVSFLVHPFAAVRGRTSNDDVLSSGWVCPFLFVFSFLPPSEQQLRKPTNADENIFPVTILQLTSGIHPLLQPIYFFIPPSEELQLPLEASIILPLVTCNCKHGHSHILAFCVLTVLSYVYWRTITLNRLNRSWVYVVKLVYRRMYLILIFSCNSQKGQESPLSISSWALSIWY